MLADYDAAWQRLSEERYLKTDKVRLQNGHHTPLALLNYRQVQYYSSSFRLHIINYQNGFLGSVCLTFR